MQDDSECSELCSCSDGGESTALSCYAICVSPAPCRTSLAYYSHASPAYQAFRGRCLCYSGKFICVRPPPGEYILPGELLIYLCTCLLLSEIRCNGKREDYQAYALRLTNLIVFCILSQGVSFYWSGTVLQMSRYSGHTQTWACKMLYERCSITWCKTSTTKWVCFQRVMGVLQKGSRFHVLHQ